MTAQEMVDLVRDRSRQSDNAKILRELRSAFRWVTNRIYVAAGGPDLLSTLGEEITISATTRDYNLGANLAGLFLGMKQLQLKLPSDLIFTPMEEADPTSAAFQARDAQPVATPEIAFGHPVLYHILNFSQVRFAPALPAGAVLRVDYFRIGLPPDPTTNNTTESGADLSELFHDAMVAKATAHCLENLDDERTADWENRARDFYNDAIYAATNRVQQPTMVRGWSRRRRRMI